MSLAANASPESVVRYSAADGIAHIELNRPEAGNALDLQTTHALRDAFQRALRAHDVDIVKLTSTGESFCVGTDTDAAQASEDPTTHVFEVAAALDELFGIIHGSSKPVLAAVQGLAAGSGLGLALAADIVLSSPSATFRVAAQDSLGAPDPGVAWLLPRAIGQPRALSFALRRRVVDAETAAGWGMTEVESGDLGRALHELAQSLTGEHLWANGETRRLLRTSWDTSRTDLSQSEAATMVRAMLRPRSQA